MGKQSQSEDKSTPEIDISWRTKELGPEMRRELFEKVFPSRASRKTSPDHPTPSGKVTTQRKADG